MIIGAMLTLGLLVAVLAVMLLLRRWTLDEARTEARLHLPATHTLAYAVPNGQDPSVLSAALAREHFTSVAELRDGRERLLVECEERDRSRVRSILEHVDRAGFTGPRMQVAGVRFEDEP